ncbi:hypothetical protein INT44_005306 [Umbelopsis vinacea]|uniref:N-acetyltransferase domain-containing protein n=1 Tax=Umbelopsis vinacea TaxID=44442 RepID=A0A8H7Q7T8_9FUNG|nr:hypothetical protein INT44_005306 [Umbelopsis vinacea]
MSNLSVKVYPGPQQFLDELRSQLDEHELENNQVIFKPTVWARDKVEGGYYAAVLDGEKLVYAGCWSPGNYLWLSWSPEDGSEIEAQELLAKHLATVESVVKGLDGYLGCEPGAKVFANAYSEATNRTVQVYRAMSTYKLTKVIWTEQCRKMVAKGVLRKATPDDDMKVIGSWYKAFNHQCKLPFLSLEECEKAIASLTKVGLLYLWCLGKQPVSMAFQLRPLKYGTSVAGVYTPPEFRKHGYASALVATLSDHLLKSYQFVTLHADDDNPTSNRIYQEMGYQLVRYTRDYKIHSLA